MTLLRKLSLTGLITSMVVLTGCATNVQQKQDAFEQQSKRLGVVYAQVNKIIPSEKWDYCNSSRASTQSKSAFCDKPDVNVVVASWVSKGSYTYVAPTAVPKSVKLEPGAIVILDMTKPAAQNFVSMASLEETEICHWDGRRNVLLDSGIRKFTEFTTVFVAVATAPVLGAGLLYGRDDLGGVVCNNWNYLEAYKDKDIAALVEPF